MITIILTTLVIVIALTLLQYYCTKRPPNFPPGPAGLPLLGYLPYLRLPIYKAFEDLSKKYGGICGFYILNLPVVLLGDVKALKEGFGNHHMLARPKVKMMTECFGSGDGIDRGIGIANGKGWQIQRRFAFKNLREFGLGRSKAEGLIMDDILDLTNSLKKVVNQPVDVVERITLSVFNSLWYIISGVKYSHDDPKVPTLVKKLTHRSALSSACLMLMPRLAKAFPKLSGFETLIACRDEVFELINEVVEAHKKTLDINNPRDFIDAYLREIALTTDPNSTFYKDEGEQQLLAVLFDLFFAGGETTATAVHWMVLYVMKHPNVQEKVHIEIDSVVGADRNPSLSDRSRMPYTEAVITETLRFSTLAPIGVPHATTESLEFNGYTIPKNTIIIGNLKSINSDKAFWGDPENFRPERFMDDEGQYKGSEGMYSFSVGKRMCPGENMARDEMFLMLAGLFQKFRFEVDIKNPPTLEPQPILGAVIPRPYSVILIDRSSMESD